MILVIRIGHIYVRIVHDLPGDFAMSVTKIDNMRQIKQLYAIYL